MSEIKSKYQENLINYTVTNKSLAVESGKQVVLQFVVEVKYYENEEEITEQVTFSIDI